MNKNILALLMIAGITVIGFSGYSVYKQISETHCEACGMLVTTEIREHIEIMDESGSAHYACCQACMFRLLDPDLGYNNLHIETYCDCYGPDYKIIIDCTQNGNHTISNPTTAVILLGGKIVQSCANNRIAYNSTAAEILIDQGFSTYTMSWQRNPLPPMTPVIPVAMVAQNMALKGISYTAPSLILPLSVGGFGLVILILSMLMFRNLNID